VTGAGGLGSGRAIACRFARDGAFVVVSHINQEGGLQTVREIERQGGQPVFSRNRLKEAEINGTPACLTRSSDFVVEPKGTSELGRPLR
jgi:NAD(P)-dependent dehydrogenase (short-subunit alcohol dehydrogenase family)